MLYFVLMSFAGFASNEKKIDTSAINILLKRSVALQRTNLDSCYLLANEALTHSLRLKYQKGIQSAYTRMGSVLMTKGFNDSSMFYLVQAAFISEKEKDYTSLAGNKMLISYVYQYKGVKDSVYYFLNQAIAYSELANNTLLRIQCMGTLAYFHQEYREYDKAIIEYKMAYKLADSANNVGEKATNLMGIGSTYYLQERYKEALPYFLQADVLAKQINDDIGVLQNLNNIALCYSDMGETTKALGYYSKALIGYQKHEMHSEEANLYYNLGCLYEKEKSFKKAIQNFSKSLTIATLINELQSRLNCYERLAQCYASDGDYLKAYQNQLQFSSLSDSLLNSEKVNSISEMQTKYETEKKNNEIVILTREKQIEKLNASRSLGITFGLGGALIGIITLAFVFYSQKRKKEILNKELTIEKHKSDNLLLNILPEEIAEELKQKGTSEAKLYNHVSVLFTDFVNFTGLSEQMSATELVQEIHQNFTAFDAIMSKHGIEKIKTIGDAYLAVCGLPNEVEDHAVRITKAAIEIKEFMDTNKGKFQIRIGIHSGPVVAGIVGVKKFAYDIWGDTVNMASRMESNSEVGKINISAATYELICEEFDCEYRGKLNAKGKGEIDMFFVVKQS